MKSSVFLETTFLYVQNTSGISRASYQCFHFDSKVPVSVRLTSQPDSFTCSGLEDTLKLFFLAQKCDSQLWLVHTLHLNFVLIFLEKTHNGPYKNINITHYNPTLHIKNSYGSPAGTNCSLGSNPVGIGLVTLKKKNKKKTQIPQTIIQECGLIKNHECASPLAILSLSFLKIERCVDVFIHS